MGVVAGTMWAMRLLYANFGPFVKGLDKIFMLRMCTVYNLLFLDLYGVLLVLKVEAFCTTLHPLWKNVDCRLFIVPRKDQSLSTIELTVLFAMWATRRMNCRL